MVILKVGYGMTILLYRMIILSRSDQSGQVWSDLFRMVILKNADQMANLISLIRMIKAGCSDQCMIEHA